MYKRIWILFGITSWKCFIIIWYSIFTSVVAQHKSELNYVIQEELDVGFKIADVISDASLTSKFDSATLSQLRFRFLTRPAPIDVSIDEVTGIITVAGRLDREQICPQEERCLRRLDVFVQPMSYFMIIKISVDILDINDNSPVFKQDKISHEMLESSVLGTTFLIPAAFDPDVGINSIQGYELRNSAHATHFKLNVTKRLDGSTDVRLTLVRALDRETADLLKLVVVAFDGGDPRKSGTLEVNVVVGDWNDNSPVLEYNSYELTILENIPLQTTVVRVQASDADLGKNAEVEYFYSPQTLQSSGDVFTINSTSGEVIVIGEVDYEKTPIYRLMVSARDRGPDPVSSDAMLTIKVEDANDNAPDIQINTLLAANTSRAEIPENVPPDTFVAHMLVRDPDSGMNGKFECPLEDQYFRLKMIYEGEFQIVTRQKLDREVMASYTLQLVCHDGGRPPLSSYRQFEVDVVDENDNVPRFEHDIYMIELKENNEPGVILEQVRASDADEGSNSRLTYFLPNKTSASFFEIEHKTGIIRAKVRLDREEFSHHRFTVAARDHGQNPKTGTCEVRITLLDVNDEAPKFSLPSYSMGLDENLPAGTEVGFVNARDADGQEFNQFSYSFYASHSPSDAFSIDPKSGRIVTTMELDRENHATYHLVVVARDSRHPSLSSTADLIIYLIDQNDNAPRWSYPPDDDLTLALPGQTSVGRVVLRLVAKDPDVGDNGDIRYTLVTGRQGEEVSDIKGMSDDNVSDYFNLDEKLGEVTLIKDLQDVPDNTSFYLKVKASDRGSRPMFITRSIRLVVNKTIPVSGGHLGQFEVVMVDRIVVIVALTCATILILVIFLTAMICVVRRRKSRNQNVMDGSYKQKYNCRIEALKALTAKETALAATAQNGCESPCRLGNGCHGLLPDELPRPCSDLGRHSCTGSDVSYICTGSDPGQYCRQGGCRSRSDCSNRGCCCDSGNSSLPNDVRHRCCEVPDDRFRPDLLNCSHRNGVKTINLLDECGVYYTAALPGEGGSTGVKRGCVADPWIERGGPNETTRHHYIPLSQDDPSLDGRSCSTVDGGFLDGSSSDAGGRGSQQSSLVEGRRLSPLRIQLPTCRANQEADGTAVTSIHLPPQVRPGSDGLTTQSSPRGSTAPASPSSSVQSYQTVIVCSVSPNSSRGVQTRLAPQQINGSQNKHNNKYVTESSDTNHYQYITGSPGRGHYTTASPGQGHTTGSPGQGHYTTGSPGQGHYTTGSPGQGHYTTGSPGQGHYITGSPGQKHYNSVSGSSDQTSPSSTYKGNLSSFLGNGKINSMEMQKKKGDCLECHDLGLMNRTSVI